MRVLVLGGTRFLGPFVVDELLARGHEVAVLSRGSAQFQPKVRPYSGNASDPSELSRTLEAWRPEGLLDMLHSNKDHTRNVIQAGAGRVSKTAHLSCASVYGFAPVCPVDEQTEVIKLEAAPPEVADKIVADQVIAEAISEGFPATIVRLPVLYGPRDPKCAEWFFVKRVLDGRKQIALPDAGLHICHRGFIQNMAWGIVQALVTPKAAGQIYNLGEEKLYTLAQLARGVARALDHEWKLYSVPGHLWQTPYVYTSFFNLRKAQSHLRYRDRRIPRDGLEITLAWLCQNPRGDDWNWPGIEQPFDYDREDALIEEYGYPLD